MPLSAATPYIGRFAPSPSGPLHAGSLVAAMASFLDARLHDGKWLLRIEDVDETRSVPGAEASIREALWKLGMRWDEQEVVVQSRRKALYQAACDKLTAGGHVYACGCTRKEIRDSATRMDAGTGTGTTTSTGADGAAIYPGTCRHGLPPGRVGRTLRLRVPAADDPARLIQFTDRWCGPVLQDLARETGDFVLRRADGFWAYQLAVVVDDAAQGVTDVVRGADLIDSTARQIYLQQLLEVPTPRFLHVPLLAGENGEKLSKQNGAPALDINRPVEILHAAAAALGLEITGDTGPRQENEANWENFWRHAVPAWKRRLQQLKVA